MPFCFCFDTHCAKWHIKHEICFDNIKLKYKNILFENPRPFIIAQLERDRLVIIETNISHEKNKEITLEYINENIEIKGLVKSTLEQNSGNITINDTKTKFNLESKKISENEVIIWFDIEDNLYDLCNANFLSNLIHEFKTPLNLIFSSVQLLNKKIENHEIEKYYKCTVIGILNIKVSNAINNKFTNNIDKIFFILYILLKSFFY